jgi:hypothetical protein
MSLIYELIGRFWVELIRRRYRREIRIAAATGVALAAVGVAAYLASREDEGDEA